jgi:RimJ/RimL family protein N-acetyltransferase
MNTRMQPPDEVTDNTIVLRRYQFGDVSRLVEAVRESGDELRPWISWYHENFSEQDARSWIETLPEAWVNGVSYDYAITDSMDGSYLGGCGINHIRWTYRFANIGYWVRTTRTQQGIASRAALLLARLAFEHLGFVRVEIVVAVGNKASHRVAQKVGAVQEGILRNRMVVGENVYDAVMHSLIPQDLGIQAG